MELMDPACPLHGPGIDPLSLVGSRLVEVLASWHTHGGRPADGPVEVWLIDDRGRSTNITSGTDWCLVVESSHPGDGFDQGDWGRIDVLPVRDETPFAAHLGKLVLGVRQEWTLATGRVALELDFPSGSIRCESWGGDLRVVAVDGPDLPPAAPVRRYRIRLSDPVRILGGEQRGLSPWRLYDRAGTGAGRPGRWRVRGGHGHGQQRDP